MSKWSTSPKRRLTDKQRHALSPELFSFYDDLVAKDLATLSAIPAEVAADAFREFFCIVCPMGTGDTRTLLEKMQYRDIFLKKGLEREKHVRGHWSIQNNQVLILIDSARPDPSKIKTLLHEIGEMLLEISYDNNPDAERLSDKKREEWANKFAAFVKMPRHLFIPAYLNHHVDLEVLSDIFAETLGGVSRHIRDLCLSEKPFYFEESHWNTTLKATVLTLCLSWKKVGAYACMLLTRQVQGWLTGEDGGAALCLSTTLVRKSSFGSCTRNYGFICSVMTLRTSRRC